MVQICLFGGHDGLINPEKKFYLTFCGGCDLVRPTLIKRILARRRQLAEGVTKPPTQFFFTMFGGVDIKVPTLAEEFLDLRRAVDTGVLTLDEWDRAITELGHSDVRIASFTLFGGLSECELPSEEEEINALALQRHLGNISDDAGRILQYAIGQRPDERTSTIRRAAVA